MNLAQLSQKGLVDSEVCALTILIILMAYLLTPLGLSQCQRQDTKIREDLLLSGEDLLLGTTDRESAGPGTARLTMAHVSLLASCSSSGACFDQFVKLL